jgi:tetratricopeptide (TPR) repeat protein
MKNAAVGTETRGSHLPRVSVIIPTYNRSRLLRAAVESALTQTYPNIEIIVVDDGSTDNTATEMAQYAARITYLRQANRGVAAARNTGIQAATGDYLTCLDDDDLILPTKIERQVQVMASRPGVGLVHCRFFYANEDGHYQYKVGSLPEGEVLGRLVCSNFVWAGAPMIHRHCLDRVGLFDDQMPSITADWDMWLRIAQAGYRFACVQEPLGVYRIHQDGMMSDVAELERGIVVVLEKVFSNTQVPDDVRGLRETAYGKTRFWISCRYYAAGRWDDARRNLSEALDLRPHLLSHPALLARLLASNALSPRVSAPFQFVANVLDHLPPRADDLRHYRPQILSQIYAGLAMRNYGDGNIDCAKRQFTQAIALNPTGFEQRQDFARFLCHSALHLPVSAPIPFVDTVLHNLPAPARRLNRVRARVLSEVHLKLAHQDYSAGQRGLAVRRILLALHRHPWLIGRRNVAAILLRSMLGSTPSPS